MGTSNLVQSDDDGRGILARRIPDLTPSRRKISNANDRNNVLESNSNCKRRNIISCQPINDSDLDERFTGQNGEEVQMFRGKEAFQDKDQEPNPRPLLVDKHQVPRYLQFNPYVLHGYRPPGMSSIDCVKSLFYFHNETINILTHVISFLLFAFVMPSRLPWDRISKPVLAYCTVLGSFSSWVGSTIYHLFMNHERGEELYFNLLKWDVIGIWITQTIGAATTIYVSVILYNLEVQFILSSLYIFFSLRALKDVLCANSVWSRILGFSYLFGLRIVAFGLRIHALESGAGSPLIHIIMQELWALLGSCISATRVPERWFPGTFDFALNSHNLMHLFVVFGAIHMHMATSADLLWVSSLDRNSTITV